MEELLLARDLGASCGNDLVCVHIGLCTGAGLPYDEREMVVQLACDDLVTRRRNGSQLFVRHLFGTTGVVRDGSRLLQNAECVCDLARHRFNADTDLEILMAALGLGTPQLIGGNLHLAHRIMLNAIFHILTLLMV